ncbi:hypothetical protein N7537_009608 [Penicillium hordei]|uniref:Apple domain-containing protein n=1 Tax=Penicillium hordei TaxID=40994 RepID=A0AAD6DUI8_9EURO|nr:uncharacterized protein N7537_009608 [Penicillium hordei]KAJ5592704.1 hypothetical protein N7537_009608 [Penicillium hordei]
MVRFSNLLLFCSAQLLTVIPLTEAKGLCTQGVGVGVAGARFGQGSGRRGGYCCCEEPEPEPEPEPETPTECSPECPSADSVTFQCNGRVFKQFCGRHVATPTLRDFDVSSYQQCFDACIEDSNCRSLDFTNNHCWLKQQGADPPPKAMPSKQDISIIFL